MAFTRSRRPILPLALWAMIAALAYAAGKQVMERKAGGHTRTERLKHRAAARKAKRSRS